MRAELRCSGGGPAALSRVWCSGARRRSTDRNAHWIGCSAVIRQHRRGYQDSNADEGNDGHGCHAAIAPWFGRALIRPSGANAVGNRARSGVVWPGRRRAQIACGYLIDWPAVGPSSDAPAVPILARRPAAASRARLWATPLWMDGPGSAESISMMMGVSTRPLRRRELPGRHAMEQCDGVLVLPNGGVPPLRYTTWRRARHIRGSSPLL